MSTEDDNRKKNLGEFGKLMKKINAIYDSQAA